MMKLSRKYAVPDDLALLYEFVNSIDKRCYVENRIAHTGSDALRTEKQFGQWMRAHSLDRPAGSPRERAQALALREALRSYLKVAPDARSEAAESGRRLAKAAAPFPLVVDIEAKGAMHLRPATGTSELGRVLAQLQGLAASDRLDRLKMCSSDECEWVFFDRSKPGNRRWCSSDRCGNRQKTRDYRERKRLVSDA
jgi:predicted RNA-binding Zn ribbon-like protein